MKNLFAKTKETLGLAIGCVFFFSALGIVWAYEKTYKFLFPKKYAQLEKAREQAFKESTANRGWAFQDLK